MLFSFGFRWVSQDINQLGLFAISFRCDPVGNVGHAVVGEQFLRVIAETGQQVGELAAGGGVGA